MAQPININNFDPQSVMATPARPLSGIMQTGTITPSDTAYYGDTVYARWLYAGNSGDVTYVKWDGTTQLLTNLTGGVWHPICSIRINSTGTTATNLVWGA